MAEPFENTGFQPELASLEDNPYISIPTPQQIKKLNLPVNTLAYSPNPDASIFATITQEGNYLYEHEVPYLDENGIEAFIKAFPGKMLLHRISLDGPAVARIPDSAQENLSTHLTGIERFGTYHTGNTVQFNQALFNGQCGTVVHTFEKGYHLYKGTALMHDGLGKISEYTKRHLFVNPFEDVLYMNFPNNTQVRMQTQSLGPAQGAAFYDLAQQSL